MKTCVVSLPDYQAAARRLAGQFNGDYRPICVHRFPDGESRVQIPVDLPDHLVICQSLDHPNDKLIELLLACQTARQQGVQRLTLVAPYLCYMRQDKAFHPGEAVSQQIIGRFLASLVDDVISVDAHLHRISHLSQAIPVDNAINLSAATALGEFLVGQVLDPVLLGPDAESRQWVQQVAAVGGYDFGVAHKTRHSDVDVKVVLPDFDFQDRTVVLVDDVVSSGHTLAQAAGQLRAAGAGAIHSLVTHALFAKGATELLQQAGIEHIWSSDSIPHPSNTIQLAGLLAQALNDISH